MGATIKYYVTIISGKKTKDQVLVNPSFFEVH